MEIWIIKHTGIERKSVEDVKLNEIGQKAWGLCHMPFLWTAPFFIIDRNWIFDLKNDPDSEVVEGYIKNIEFAISNLKLDDCVILRSSGALEGMKERGKYESIISKSNEIKLKLFELADHLLNFQDVKDNGIPIIVQSYVGSQITGHISNERRFVKESRDFVLEYRHENNSLIETKKIHLRNWREKINFDINRELIETEDLLQVTKEVCAYYYYNKKRIHLEFVEKEKHVYIVQCDYEIEDKDAVDPNDYDIQIYDNKEISLNILRKIDKSDEGKYKKIENVFVYKRVGEVVPPLYILDDREIINQLAMGVVNNELRKDIDNLINNRPIVIRTNIASDDKLISQLSRRSNEVKNINDALIFLKETAAELNKEKYEDYIFIIHNFIPSKIAAFVNAKPMQQEVEIQALWGLPEGLYYNSYDRIIVNTINIAVERLDVDKFSIKKIPFYKEKFVAPDKTGKWIIKKLKAPYDWKCCINDDNLIKDIAYRARKIAEETNEELTIMWFIGIDKDYYGVSSIPWYHEKYDRDEFYQIDSGSIYKKKYFYEKEFIIDSNESLRELENIGAKNIGIVRIQPKDDELLRSKDFINNLGEICKSKGLNILLEGSVLTHPYYQLLNTGATVLSAYKYVEKSEEIEFNKLVRDKIPNIIFENGESVKCIEINGIGFLRAIKNKFIEEAYEIIDSKSNEELLEELADMEELCSTLEKNIDLIDSEMCIENICMDDPMSFDLCHSGKQSNWVVYNGIPIHVTVVRSRSDIQIDIIFNDHRTSNTEDKFQSYDEHKMSIIENAFKLKYENKKEECIKYIKEIREAILCVLKKNKYNIAEFESKREKKKEAKGGFDKRYILINTALKKNEESSFVDSRHSLIEKRYIPIEEKYREDIDNLNQNRVLVRLTMPIYIQRNEWSFDKLKIKRFFNEDVVVHLKKKYSGTKLLFELKIEKNQFEQLKFNFSE